MRKSRIIVGLQVMFLIGAFIFVVCSACHRTAIHSPTSALESLTLDRLWKDALEKDAFDETRLKDRASADAQILTAAETFRDGRTPDNVLAEIPDIDGVLSGVETDKGTAAVVIARNMPAQPIVGLTHRPVMSKRAGVQIFGVAKQYVDNLTAKMSTGAGVPVVKVDLTKPPVTPVTMGVTGIQPAQVMVAPFTAAEARGIYAAIANTLGVQEANFIASPAQPASAEAAFNTLSFSRPIVYNGAETTSVEAVTTTLGEFAEEFAVPGAITEGPHGRTAANFAYPGLYLETEDMRYANEQGATYSIEAIMPITVAGEVVKTKAVVSTNAMLISPINEPALVLISEHITSGGTTYLFPEAGALTSGTAMRLAGAELQQSPVAVGHIIVVGKGAKFVIPAGLPHSVVSPAGHVAPIEKLASAEQMSFPVTYRMPSQMLHGLSHRIMKEQGPEGGISVLVNSEYEDYYGMTPMAKTGIAASQLGMGGSLYSLIHNKQLEATKVTELLKTGKISQPSAELSAFSERGAFGYVRANMEGELSSAAGMPVSVKAASGGVVVEILEGAASVLDKGKKTTVSTELDTTQAFLQRLGIELVSLPVKSAEKAAEYLAEIMKTPETLAKVADLAKKVQAAVSAEDKEKVIAGITDIKEATVGLPTGETAIVVSLPEGKLGLQVISTKQATESVIAGETFETGYIEQLKKGTQHQVVVLDLDTLVIPHGTTKTGQAYYAPAVHAITTIVNLNKAGLTGLHVGVISNKFSTPEVMNILQQAGIPTSIFAGVYGDVKNAEAMTDVVGRLQNEVERRYDTKIERNDIIFSIAEANQGLLDALSKAKLGVLVQTIMAPNPGQYISLKESLIAAIRTLSLDPKIKQALIDSVGRAEKIQPVDARKEDKYEAIDDVRDILLENV